MLPTVIRRLGQSLFVLALVALIAFLIFRYVGDPVNNLLGQEATVADRAELRERLGLNNPWYVQYADFASRALRFDFGISYRTGLPVSDMIAQRLPATIELALASALFALVLGVILGIYTAINRNGWLAQTVLSLSLVDLDFCG